MRVDQVDALGDGEPAECANVPEREPAPLLDGMTLHSTSIDGVLDPAGAGGNGHGPISRRVQTPREISKNRLRTPRSGRVDQVQDSSNHPFNTNM